MQLLLHQQQQQFEACQLSLIEKLTKQFSTQNLGSSNSEKTESIGSSTVEFNFEPSTGISKDPGGDILTYTGKVNRECERSKIRSLTDDQFKCLIFVCGLKSSVDSDIRTRILAEIERKPDMTLQEVTVEC
ncbi:unnamed protein product [Trichobilharzia regenti]|nr:unnamed protein product [Trichobilharzia regenti]